MRVISGRAKGLPLKAVPGIATRPTTDKVKEALFSIIGPYFDGERVLDLFAGTGGLGIEALSRGAGHAVFVDASPRSVEVVRRNLETARLTDQAEVYRNDAWKAVKVLAKKGLPFDLIFIDPPYTVKNIDELLLDMESRGLISDYATAVIEHAEDTVYPDFIGSLERFRLARYGETALSVYRCRKTDTSKENKAQQAPERGIES